METVLPLPVATTPTTEHTCPVCVTDITPKNKPIPCPHCSFQGCETCYMQYIADHPYHRARCMEPSCHHEFSRKFLSDHFKPSYLRKQYTQHWNALSVQQEMLKLPQTQELIRLKDKHVQRQETLRLQLQQNPDNAPLAYLYQFYIDLAKHHLYADETTEPQQPITTQGELDTHVRFYNDPESIASGEKEKPSTGNCPSNDCRGLLTPDYQCGICHVQVCQDCHEALPSSPSEATPQHRCDPFLLESIQTIAQETKPCPTCHVPIYKTEGCTHMWCVQCHTAFSWKTGQPIQRFHNPHHQEWMTLNSPSPSSSPFGRDMFLQIREQLEKHLEKQERHPLLDLYLSLCNSVGFVEAFIRPAASITRFERTTEKIREEYLRSTTSETEFHRQIGKAYRDLDYHTEANVIFKIYYIDQMKEIFGNLLEKLTLLSDPDPATGLSIVSKYTKQMERSLQTTEDLLEQCSKIHGKVGFFKFICKKESRQIDLGTGNPILLDRISLGVSIRTPIPTPTPTSSREDSFTQVSGPPVTYLTQKFTTLSRSL